MLRCHVFVVRQKEQKKINAILDLAIPFKKPSDCGGRARSKPLFQIGASQWHYRCASCTTSNTSPLVTKPSLRNSCRSPIDVLMNGGGFTDHLWSKLRAATWTHDGNVVAGLDSTTEVQLRNVRKRHHTAQESSSRSTMRLRSRVSMAARR